MLAATFGTMCMVWIQTSIATSGKPASQWVDGYNKRDANRTLLITTKRRLPSQWHQNT